MREAALQYAEAGYALTAWERKFGKGPRDEQWGLRPFDPQAVSDRHNLGLNHGLSHTAVLDADDLILTRQVLEAFGVDIDALAKETMTWVGNPDNRLKLAFRNDTGHAGKKLVIERAGKQHVVFELRGARPGGQSQDVLPPSIHPGTRRPYQFITGLRARAELPELPPALLHMWQNWGDLEDALKRLAGCESPPPRTPQHKASHGHHDNVIGQFNAKYTAAEIIERNGYEKRGKRWIHPHSTTDVAGVIQFPDGCLYAHGGGALADGTSHDAFDCFKILEHGGDITNAVRAAAELLGINRDRNRNGADSEAAEVLAALRARGMLGRETSPPGDDSQPGGKDTDAPLFATADTLRGNAYSTPRPVIAGLLLVGATLVHGPAKKGKSWLLLQMAVAIDDGQNFLGLPAVRSGVLYIGAEDTAARFKSRLERMCAFGSAKFMDRDQLKRFAKLVKIAAGDEPVGVDRAVRALWKQAEHPTVLIIDTQEQFEMLLGIEHGHGGDSVTRRDYRATSVYDDVANILGIAIVLVGHWGEMKSIEKATFNPHECINTTKARLAGVTTSITLGPLPNQEPGEAHSDMQLSVRSRDLEGGDQFLWVEQNRDTGCFSNRGPVQDVLLTQAQAALFDTLMTARKEHGVEHWMLAADIAEQLGCSTQAVKQMVARVRKAAKAQGRKPTYQMCELESKPNMGYRLK